MHQTNVGPVVERRFGALLEAAPDAMLIVDADGTIVLANSHTERMFCCSKRQLLGISVEQLVPARFREAHVSHRKQFSASASARPMGRGRADLYGLRADGSEFPVEISLNPLEHEGNKLVVAAIRDMSLRKRAEDSLREMSVELERNQARLRAVLDSLCEGVIVFSLEGKVLDANPSALHMHGFDDLNSAQKNIRDFARDFSICLLDGTPLPVEEWPVSRIAAGETLSNVELEVWRHSTARRTICSYSVSPVVDGEGKPILGVCTVRDITQQKEAEERLRQASLHDALTGLPNRALLFEYSRHVFARTRRSQRNAAVLFIDLDRFKPINDIHGHEVGDAVLQEVAQRLKKNTRQEDISFRLGGDEFLIILSDIEDGAYAGEVARHLTHCLSQPILVHGMALSLSCSIGISVYPRDSEDIDTLIKQADIAMYHVKHSGRNRYHFYSPALAERANAQIRIENQLKTALALGQFRLHYQPVIDVTSGTVQSVEALLRWPNETGPERFVPVAETTGLIGKLGEWVVAEACRQHVAWIARGLPAIPIAVNVSAAQFQQSDFVGSFVRAIQGCKIDARALQVELTETALMGDIDRAIEQLLLVKALGIKVALDDFGTGYSSLSYLSRLPIDKIKVDKSFVFRIESDTTSRTITEAIIALGHTLHLEVVAEGIESPMVLQYLRAHGCNQAQGYHVCEPVAADEFESWYRDRAHAFA